MHFQVHFLEGGWCCGLRTDFRQGVVGTYHLYSGTHLFPTFFVLVPYAFNMNESYDVDWDQNKTMIIIRSLALIKRKSRTTTGVSSMRTAHYYPPLYFFCWKLVFKISGFRVLRSRIICPKSPLAQLNQGRVHLPASETLTLSWIRPNPPVLEMSWLSMSLISSSSSVVIMPTMRLIGHAMPGPMCGPPVPLSTGPWP